MGATRFVDLAPLLETPSTSATHHQSLDNHHHHHHPSMAYSPFPPIA
jgi:hypothetical protein